VADVLLEVNEIVVVLLNGPAYGGFAVGLRMLDVTVGGARFAVKMALPTADGV